jgi:hypothetical protein
MSLPLRNGSRKPFGRLFRPLAQNLRLLSYRERLNINCPHGLVSG